MKRRAYYNQFFFPALPFRWEKNCTQCARVSHIPPLLAVPTHYCSATKNPEGRRGYAAVLCVLSIDGVGRWRSQKSAKYPYDNGKGRTRPLADRKYVFPRDFQPEGCARVFFYYYYYNNNFFFQQSMSYLYAYERISDDRLARPIFIGPPAADSVTVD